MASESQTEAGPELRERLDRVEEELKTILSKLDRFEDISRCLWVPIESFEPELYCVRRPFTAVISVEDGEFIASWFDAGIHASGETEESAISDLKSRILDAFDRLHGLEDEQLGPGMRRQRDVLKSYIERRES